MGFQDQVFQTIGRDRRFGAKICLITSFRDTCYIEILPKNRNPARALSELLEQSALQLTICYCRCSHKKSQKEPLAFLH
ncbi:hypothetical protein ABKV19_001608 [Rosa sericea]